MQNKLQTIILADPKFTGVSVKEKTKLYAFSYTMKSNYFN